LDRTVDGSTESTRLVLGPQDQWHQRAAVGRQNFTRAQIGDADNVLDILWLLFTTVRAAARPHQDLVLENLLLRLTISGPPIS
jgi:hypothetical protein